jgi:hypothetical protein
MHFLSKSSDVCPFYPHPIIRKHRCAARNYLFNELVLFRAAWPAQDSFAVCCTSVCLSLRQC